MSQQDSIKMPERPSYSQLVGSGAGTPSKPSSTIVFSAADSSLPPAPHPAFRAAAISAPPAVNSELCVFAVTGKCRYGSICRSIHGLQCPRCLLFCLHPTDLDQNEAHIEECLSKPMKNDVHRDEEIECGICLERILSKPDPRFGLLNCEHAFCLSCIRQWRSTNTSPVDSLTLRSCPLCRVVTYFIVPSGTWVKDADEKARIIDNYKRKLQEIPCRHFNFGSGTCPFGSSCFYSHRLPDGSLAPPTEPAVHIRSYVDHNEQVKTIREFRLSDFLPGAQG